MDINESISPFETMNLTEFQNDIMSDMENIGITDKLSDKSQIESANIIDSTHTKFVFKITAN